jgi:hypothetical protein
MQGVLGAKEQHEAAAHGGEAAQTGRAARDGDDQVEGQEALAALGLAAVPCAVLDRKLASVRVRQRTAM